MKDTFQECPDQEYKLTERNLPTTSLRQPVKMFEASFRENVTKAKEKFDKEQTETSEYKENLKMSAAEEERKRTAKTKKDLREIIAKTYRDQHRIQHNSGLPKFWKKMTAEKMCVLVRLRKDSMEYRMVANVFNEGRIESLQIEQRNPHIEVEMYLYHGTSADATENINKHGFNATELGEGLYFAVNPRVAAGLVFAPPDSRGNRYMYIARVLVGNSAKGSPGLKEAPLRGDSEGIRYDSVSAYDRSVFVIFSDVHAYPEYLITYKA
ncbi:hypothetical protein LSH36_989g00016 [Paralvinella palmiformis]|uniref:Poly [ADP-ribose] polymerase n=1 Tax=Paralvinella palmiformis TaxID=53620 RepID=A0AAD9MS58_9ANNE|nr:hypothetical protein LSH36_989g00016 [Paralvinella palmiformis]